MRQRDGLHQILIDLKRRAVERPSWGNLQECVNRVRKGHHGFRNTVRLVNKAPELVE